MFNIKARIDEILNDFITKARTPTTSKIDIRVPIHHMIDACARDYNICVIAGGSTPYEFYQAMHKKQVNV
jgi:hypothetical protein